MMRWGEKSEIVPDSKSQPIKMEITYKHFWRVYREVGIMPLSSLMTNPWERLRKWPRSSTRLLSWTSLIERMWRIKSRFSAGDPLLPLNRQFLTSVKNSEFKREGNTICQLHLNSMLKTRFPGECLSTLNFVRETI